MAKRATTKRTAKKAQPSDLTGQERIVLLHGKEAMLKTTAMNRLREALTKEHGEVETFIFPGRSPLADVLDELRGYSLMSGYKIVVVDEADEFSKAHRDALIRYAENPVDHATFVMRAEKWVASNLDKAIAKTGVVVKCDALSSADASKWLIQHARDEHQIKLAPDAARTLVDRAGSDLMTLGSELAKLILSSENGQVTVSLIEDMVHQQSDEQAWAVQEALLGTLTTGRAEPTLQMVDELIRLSGQAEVQVMYFVLDILRKLALGQMMKQSGMNDFAIGKALKLWPREREQRFVQALSKLEPVQAQRLLSQALEMDRRGKSGQGRILGNLECFCASLSDN